MFSQVLNHVLKLRVYETGKILDVKFKLIKKYL